MEKAKLGFNKVMLYFYTENDFKKVVFTWRTFLPSVG